MSRPGAPPAVVTETVFAAARCRFRCLPSHAGGATFLQASSVRAGEDKAAARQSQTRLRQEQGSAPGARQTKQDKTYLVRFKCSFLSTGREQNGLPLVSQRVRRLDGLLPAAVTMWYCGWEASPTAGDQNPARSLAGQPFPTSPSPSPAAFRAGTTSGEVVFGERTISANQRGYAAKRGGMRERRPGNEQWTSSERAVSSKHFLISTDGWIYPVSNGPFLTVHQKQQNRHVFPTYPCQCRNTSTTLAGNRQST
jgi:hypothetical protein